MTKEEASYVQEAKDQQARIQSFIDDERRGEHDVRKQREVLQDSLKMIPDCRKRLEASVDDLSTFLVSIPSLLLTCFFETSPLIVILRKQNGINGNDAIKQVEEYAAAEQALQEAQAKLQTPLPDV